MIETEVMTLIEVAEYLKLSEKTIHRMIRKQEIPCSKVGGQWRFLRSLLNDWLLSQMQPIPKNDLSSLIREREDMVPLSRLMNKDYIRLDISPGDKRHILNQLIQPLVKKGFSEDKLFLDKLMEREEMASTAVGYGVALPHLRRPQENLLKEPAILAGRCDKGTDFNSFDGNPTYLFFLIVTDSEVIHLKVMAKLAALLKNEDFINSLKTLKNPEKFMNQIIEEDGKYRNLRAGFK